MFWSNKHKRRFKELAYPQYERLYRLAYARLGHQQDAEDIVQETYLKAFNAFNTFKDGTNIEAWLTQILINTIRDYVRKVTRMPLASPLDELTLNSSLAIEDKRPGPEEQLCASEIDPELMQALQSLPESFLSVFLLREIEGATYQEIAKILDIPAGTVMSRLSRSRELLRTKLGQPGFMNAKNQQQNNPATRAEVEP